MTLSGPSAAARTGYRAEHCGHMSYIYFKNVEKVMYKMDRKGGGLRKIFLEEITACYA
jgi:hypothetical protein